MKDEGGRMKERTKEPSVSTSSFILHPSYLLFVARLRKRDVTSRLLEDS